MYTTKIGHAHLKVRNLDRAIAFYTKVFNQRVVERISDHYAFLTGGDMHHEIALQSVGANAPTQHPYGTGLYHIAFEVADRRSMAELYQVLKELDVRVALVDHLISWAMYFEDPDGNGLEVYVDTRRDPSGQELWHGRNVALTEENLLAALAV